MISIGNLQINKLYLGDVEVTKAYLGDVQVYGSKPKPVGKYMTITVDDAAGETVIKPMVTGSLPNLKLQYRVNNGNWNDFIVGTTADIHLTSGNFVQFRGNNQNGLSIDYSNYLRFSISDSVHLSGNIMSLIDGKGETLVIPNNYCFCRLFSSAKVKTVSSDFLPATTLKNWCYYSMFYNCSNLVQAPELPATIVVDYCYSEMFLECTSLTQAPELPATTLADGCYDSMFSYCTSLVQLPKLPATTLAHGCYRSMFSDCENLTQAPELPATTLADGCYNGMFGGCVNLTQAPELPATTLANECYYEMFQGCTSLVQAPELPATTLVDYCYYYMFFRCSNLNYVKCNATEITATNALNQWLSRVSSTGTFVKPAGVSYETGASGIPENWSIVEEKPKPEGKYMTITVDDAAGETTISPTIKGSLPNLNLQYRINNNGDWTNFIVGTTADIQVVSGDWVQFKGNNPNGFSIDDGNYLNFAVSGNPVALSGNVMSLIDGVGETLVVPGDFCFCKLFSKSNVKTVSSDFLPATTLTNSCYSNMFNGCKSLTTAPELPATTLADSCYEMMFWECSSLETAPAFPATTLANNCYGRMFFKCTSLVNVPEILPATTLADSCYIFMFYGCTSLTTAPELPATTLVSLCYQSMFSGCTSLNYVKCLATSGTINNGSVPMTLYNWLYNVSSTGTFVKPAGVEYVLNSNGGIPKGWTIQNI